MRFAAASSLDGLKALVVVVAGVLLGHGSMAASFTTH
jgi:hypothetical protein